MQNETLYGVTKWRELSVDGTRLASHYLTRRFGLPGDFYGFMKDASEILWFRDRGHRDEFMREFEGVSLTLERKKREVITDLDRLRKLGAL